MALDVSDLIGKPYRKGSSDPAVGLDCWGSVVEAHRRLGHGEVQADPSLWVPLGCDMACATEVGDIAVGDGAQGALSVAVVVSVSPRLWLTALEGHVVRCTRHPHVAGSIRGVYRWRGVA